ncbi:MAG: hypothetical protein HXS52_08515 [Theionarchaea archaeon]|nr:hypothetical protein [Theionarchaea archaeon]MBU7037961.1 hypothetical protein [Theionarchaea archaeon]
MVQRTGLVLASVLGSSILAGVVLPYPFYIVAWMVGLFFVTGAGILLHLEPTLNLDTLLTSVLVGLCVHVVYGYVLGALQIELTLWLLLAPSVLSSISVMRSRQNIHLNLKDSLLLIPLMVFVVLAGHAVPGEQAGLFAFRSIMEAGFIPSHYPLYEIPLKTPLGFHFLVYEVLFLAGDWHSYSLCGVILSSLAFIPCYLMAKSLHSEKAGWAAGMCALFASVALVDCAQDGLYSLGLSLVIQGTVMYWALDSSKQCSARKLVLVGLGCAAGIEVHTSFVVVLPAVLVLALYGVFRSYRGRPIKPLAVFGGSLFVFFIPFVGQSCDVTSSIHEVAYWAGEIGTAGTPGFVTANVGIWVIFIGAVGFLFVRKVHVLFFAGWIGLGASAALISGFMLSFPVWSMISSAEGLKILSIPLSVLAGIGLVHLTKPSWSIVFLLLLMSVTPQPVVRETPSLLTGPFVPADSQYFLDDQEAMQLLEPYPDSYILNDWWMGTGSSWILPLVERKVMFPYLYRYDGAVSTLNIPEKEKKSFLVAALPDIEPSLLFLREEGVDYVFLSGYIRPEVAWRRILWDPECMLKSLNYNLVFHRGDTYLFKVLPSFTFSNTYRISEVPTFVGFTGRCPAGGGMLQSDVQPVLVDFDGNGQAIIAWGSMSFRPALYVRITFLDSGFDPFDILVREQEEFFLATVPRTNSGLWETLYFRLPVEIEEGAAVMLTPHGTPVTVSDVAVMACFHGMKVSDEVVLVGDSWSQVNEVYVAKSSATTSHIYVLSPLITVVNITYFDDAPGNVDFNILLSGGQLGRFILERTGDGNVKCVSIPIPTGYSFLDIGVSAWESDLTILAISCE